MTDSQTLQSLNQILYGPPGTGKTYSTINAALAILDSDYLERHGEDRGALKRRFDVLVEEHRVRFITFHQSFSYEDFIEGLRATTSEESGQIRYDVVDGVFKSLCDAAAAKVSRPMEVACGQVEYIDVRGRRIWKMSLGNTQGSDASIYDECVHNGYVLLGWGGNVDFAGCNSREDVLQRFQSHNLKRDPPRNDYEVKAVDWFVTRMKPGDLVVISDGNFKFRAIGEVAGGYQFQPHVDFVGDFSQRRSVRWLRTYEPSLPHDELMKNQFSQMTLYELRQGSIDLDKLQRLLSSGSTTSTSGGLQTGPLGGYVVTKVTSDLVELTKPNGNHLAFAMNMLATLADGIRAGQITFEDIRSKEAVDKIPGKGLEPHLVNGYNNILAQLVEQLCSQAATESHIEMKDGLNNARVLIIDEINRGNISRIFGELITLIEPSKRAGADEQLEVVLPYSKRPFSVPKNVYIIGTMNTADRSLTSMDVALRRRFVFVEMPPRPDLLGGIAVDGIPIDRLLAILNQRIEALLDRDHCLGHAYFMPLRQTSTLSKLGEIFLNRVLPLLQEYFFDDWQRIQWVLNDHRKSGEFRFITRGSMDAIDLFGPDVNVVRNPQAWTINNGAFRRKESYLGVIDVRGATEGE